MKVNYNGYEVEGTVDEIKELLGKRQDKSSVVPGDFSWKKKDKRKWKMSEKHKEKIRKGIKKYNDEERIPWHKKSEGVGLTAEQKKYILNAKESNTSFVKLALRFNKKFGTNYTKNKIKNKYWKIRGE